MYDTCFFFLESSVRQGQRSVLMCWTSFVCLSMHTLVSEHMLHCFRNIFICQKDTNVHWQQIHTANAMHFLLKQHACNNFCMLNGIWSKRTVTKWRVRNWTFFSHLMYFCSWRFASSHLYFDTNDNPPPSNIDLQVVPLQVSAALNMSISFLFERRHVFFSLLFSIPCIWETIYFHAKNGQLWVSSVTDFCTAHQVEF